MSAIWRCAFDVEWDLRGEGDRGVRVGMGNRCAWKGAGVVSCCMRLRWTSGK